MKYITIGLMGTLVSNENMGCVALTYSLMRMLECISKRNNVSFKYIIFEYRQDRECYQRLSYNLNIDESRILYSPVGFLNAHNPKLMIKKSFVNLSVCKAIKNCNLVIDLTQGDSFTDIYGFDRFQSLTNAKKLVQSFHIPLILGPQTYGPFQDTSVKEKAKTVIEKAVSVISRDQESKKYLSTFCSKKVVVATDLAFGLPFRKESLTNNRIRVGINPSGLLVKGKTEKTNLQTRLTTDYDRFIHEIIEHLISSEIYEVHLIPHVGDDAVNQYKNMKGVVAHSAFKTPIDAKSCIASMDVFIGARMHATIAAFSAGVATIPTAYSRKFSGLFENLGYDHVIDLIALNTDEAVKQTLKMIADYKNLKSEVDSCMFNVYEKLNILESSLNQTIMKCIGNSLHRDGRNYG